MKKLILSISLFISVLLGGSSCSDYLDIVPEGTPGIDNAFSNRINSFKYLHGCYSYLPQWGNAGYSLGFLAGDEHWLIPKGTGMIESRVKQYCWDIGRGSQNINKPLMDYWNGAEGGSNLWQGIRDCNIFLENIHKPMDVDDYERDRWISEVKFLKAYYHFFLFQLYGPIPIMDKNVPVDATTEDVRLYREPVDKVVQYISDLLDESLENLPDYIMVPAEEMGRITRPIAKAVKAQLWLLAASPLFNGNTAYKDVADNRGVKIFATEYDPSKWEKAAAAAKDAIETATSKELGANAAELYYFTESIRGISDATIQQLTIGGSVTEDDWANNREIIWGSVKENVNDLQTLSIAFSNKGAYYTARALLSPTMSVVENFYSSNGVPISEDNSVFWKEMYPQRYEYTQTPTDGNNIYYFTQNETTGVINLNREPRYYASLFFDRGTRYASGYKDDTQKELAHYKMRRKESGGLLDSEDHSITGYLNKKVCSYKSSLTSSAWSPKRYPFPIIRLADLYLMYAEALNETMEAPNEEVFKYIDLVRKRAGLEGVKEAWSKYSTRPNKPNTRDGMREIIRTERLNELAGEGKRFWDLRRWKIELPQQVMGWNINGENAEQFYKQVVVFNRPRYTYKDFLWPIKLQDIQRNPNLVQNPGW